MQDCSSQTPAVYLQPLEIGLNSKSIGIKFNNVFNDTNYKCTIIYI